MTRSATDIMQEIIFSSVLDSIAALKTASKGLPNTLLRDINALHANTTFADLPPELQAAISTSVRSAFTRLLKEGYSVYTGQPAREAAPRRGMPDRSPRAGPPPRRGSDPAGPPRGGRPGRKPGPR